MRKRKLESDAPGVAAFCGDMFTDQRLRKISAKRSAGVIADCKPLV